MANWSRGQLNHGRHGPLSRRDVLR